jgi:hypothetical protein
MPLRRRQYTYSYMHRLVVALVLPLFLGAVPVHAQFASTDPLTVSVSPENPKPYDTVTVTPDSTLVDLAAARITVSVNGKVVVNGGGVQSVPITVGGPGERTSITVSASVGGQTYTKQVTLRPADVSLVLEPVSTTHPFYRGASLTAPQGRVRIIALADLRSSPGARINPSTLVYTWKWGDKVLADQSGIGRYILSVSAPVRYRDAQITVTVATVDSTVIAQSSTVVSPIDPVVRIYRNDPLMGPNFNRALSDGYSMTSQEEAFRGVAYYFGTLPSLSWAVNGQAASTDREVTVRATGSGEGNASLSLSASASATGQSASQALSVHFGAKKTNIFGF